MLSKNLDRVSILSSGHPIESLGWSGTQIFVCGLQISMSLSNLNGETYRRQNFLSQRSIPFLCCLILQFALVPVAYSQTTLTVQQCVLSPTSQPVQDLGISFFNTAGDSFHYAYTDSSGCASISLEEDSYIVTIQPRTVYTYNSSSEVLQNYSFLSQINISNSFYSSINDQIELPTYTLEPASDVIEVTVVESDTVSSLARALGDPVPEVQVTIYDPADPSVWLNGTSNSAGKVFFSIDNIDAPELIVYSYDPNNNFTDSQTKIQTSSGLNQSTLQVRRTTAQVNFQLLNSSGSAFTVPQDIAASVMCYTLDTPSLYFSKGIDYGASSATLKTTSGYFKCGVYIEGYATTSSSTSVSDNETVNVQSQVYSKNASVRFRVLDDETGQLINYPFSFGLSTPYDPDGTGGIEDWSYANSSNGVAILQAVDGVIYEPYLSLDWSNGTPPDLPYIMPSSYERITASASAETLIELRLLPTTATVQVNLIDANNNPYTPDPEAYASVECGQTQYPYLYFYKSIDTYADPIPTSGIINLIAGSYTCRARVEGYGTSEESIVVNDNDNRVISSKVISRDANVNIKVIDSKSRLPIQHQLEYNIYSQWASNGTREIEDYSYQFSDKGQVTLPVISGIDYAASIYRPVFLNLEDLQVSGEAFPYILSNQAISFQAQPDETLTLEILLDRAEAFLNVNYVDTSGNSVSDGWLDVYCRATEPQTNELKTHSGPEIEANDPTQDFYTGTPIVNGTASLALFANRECEARVFPPYFPGQELNYLPSKVQFFTLADNETATLEFVAEAPNFTLNITALIDSTEMPSFLGCHAYNSSGQESFTQKDPPLTDTIVALGLLVDEEQTPYSVGCYAVVGAPGSERYYFSLVDWVPPSLNSGNEASLTIGPLEENGVYYPQETYTFSASDSATFTLADGRTSVSIPANAFASSGTVVLKVVSGTGYTFNDDAYPTLTFDFSITVDGEPVTTTQFPITIRFGYDQAFLDELGISEAQLAAGSFREESRTWTNDASYEVDTENDTVTVTVSHFSIWGILGKISSSLKAGLPHNLKAKKVKTKGKKKNKGSASKKQSYNLSWTAPSGVSNPTFRVRLLKLKPGKARRLARQKRSRIRPELRAKSYDLDSNKAKAYETSEVEMTLKLPRGNKFVFDVSVVADERNPNGSTESTPKVFKVR